MYYHVSKNTELKNYCVFFKLCCVFNELWKKLHMYHFVASVTLGRSDEFKKSFYYFFRNPLFLTFSYKSYLFPLKPKTTYIFNVSVE